MIHSNLGRTRAPVLLATLLVLLLTLALPSQADARTRCGHVSATGSRYRVDLVRGRLRCRRARTVIAYVLTHGKPSQSEPGSSPRGWSCGYGYGYRNGHREQTARAGPLCERDGVEVQGTVAGYTPLLARQPSETLLGCSAGTYPPSSDFRPHPRECIVYRGNLEAHYTEIWMQRLRWRGWGARVAHARGRWHYCGMGSCPSGPLKARAFRPVYACGHYAYTRLRVHVVVRNYHDSTYLVHLRPC